MGRSYSDMDLLIQTKVADTAGTVFLSAERVYQIDECLKEFASYKPHITPIVFKIESRYGVDTTGAASTLTDTVKEQFVVTDDDNEKVVHNTTNNTWGIVKTASTSKTILTLNSSLMRANDNYEIYNTRCWNNKQIYVGNILPMINDIESVEYPIGEKRNWKILSEGVLEIDVDSVPDSNSNTAIVGSAPNTDVLVRFYRPHILNAMSTLTGTVAGTVGVDGASTISVLLAASAMVVKEGYEVNFAVHRQSYIVTANATANSAKIAAISVYPAFDGAVGSAATVTFVKSTLEPNEEEMFANLTAGRLMEHKSPAFANAISLGGGVVWQNYYTMGKALVDEALRKLRNSIPPKTSHTYPSE